MDVRSSSRRPSESSHVFLGFFPHIMMNLKVKFRCIFHEIYSLDVETKHIFLNLNLNIFNENLKMETV